jgi:hypothetical protein
MNKAERVNKKTRSKQSLRSQKAKRHRDNSTSKKRQTTSSTLVRKASNRTNGFKILKKDRRRVITSASNCLQNSSIGMKANMLTILTNSNKTRLLDFLAALYTTEREARDEST